jgi:transcriptional regulator with XRE-family HTH domain
VTALARKAGIQPTTATSWWTKGIVPDNASLKVLADALGVEHSELVAAYEGSTGRTWVLTDPALEALIERTVETTVRRVLAEQDRTRRIDDPASATGGGGAGPTTPGTTNPPRPPTGGSRRITR